MMDEVPCSWSCLFRVRFGIRFKVTLRLRLEDKHLIRFFTEKDKALRSTSYNKTLSRKEMDIKLNAVDYKIWGIMQDRVYARKITSVDGTQAAHL